MAQPYHRPTRVRRWRWLTRRRLQRRRCADLRLLSLLFKIVQRLGMRWRTLNGGATVMSHVLAGARFSDGILVGEQPREEVQAA